MAETLIVELEKGPRSFRFHLHHRPLKLGDAGTVRYYWMDSREFRRRHPGPNYRACVDSWWADVEMAGETHHLENLFNLVLAESFPLVNTARSLQDVYLDAHLHDTADREILHDPDDRQGGISLRLDSLPQEEIRRLHDLVGRRSVASVRAELEGLFLGPLPSEAEMPGCARATEMWASNGAVAFKTGGRDALRSYVHTQLRPWLSRYRKRGGDERTRLFINMFSYECKVAFYLCYANAWIGLIRSLVDRHGLDPMSERFLRLWHHQNQPIEDPAAPGGVQPDVFFGQILALHPLSAIVHAEPSYLRAIGHWIGHPDYDALNQRGRVGDCPAYWDMVAAILIAAHEYRRSHQRWDERRGVREISGGENRTDPARDEAPASTALLFEDYARARGIGCTRCAAPLVYQHADLPGEGRSEVRVVFRCRDAGHERSVSITEEDLRAFVEES